MDFNKFTEADKHIVAKNNKISKGFTLTNDQQRAVEGILDFINNPNSKEIAVGLTGAAGTGKTFTLKTIIKNCGYATSVIGLSTPTHKASRVLAQATGFKTTTIHSDLGLRLNINSDDFDIDNPPFDPLAERKIKNYKLYIVDEASMLSRSLKGLLEREARANDVKIIYTGDSSQLPPVKESFSSAFTGIRLFQLNEVVRQGDDNPVSEILEILRKDIKNKSFRFLQHITDVRSRFNDDHTKGYMTVSHTEFSDMVANSFSNKEFTTNVDLIRLICYTNRKVAGWNNFIRHNIIKDCDRSILTNNDLINCYTTILDEYGAPIIVNSEDYIIKEIMNYKNSFNIDGFLIKFISVYGGVETKNLFIVNHGNQTALRLYLQQYEYYLNKAKNANKYERSGAWKAYFKFKEQNLLLCNITDNVGNIMISRDLDYAFAFTANRAQGSTFTNVCVDVNDIIYDKNGKPYGNINDMNRRLYVAVSRCKDTAILSYG